MLFLVFIIIIVLALACLLIFGFFFYRKPKDLHKVPGTNSRYERKQNKWVGSFNGKHITPGSKWDIIRKKIFERDNHSCTICGSTKNLTVDHIKELSLGGTNEMSNLRTLCGSCHEERHGRKFLSQNFDADDNYGENYQVNAKIAKLQKAIDSDDKVGIKYVDQKGRYSERVLHPKRLYNKTYVRYPHAYVEAYDELESEDRTFRVSRIRITNSKLNFYD
jgi:5-methylcytosine-specific restriction endonuclease McrA